jgi:outer membrane protein OmpA-like peptidoglycan-associated protein
MTTTYYIKPELSFSEYCTKLYSKYLFFIAFISLLFPTFVKAQDTTYSNPSWWFGAAIGTNVNFYRGATETLNESFSPPTTFHNGIGKALFVAPLVEYHRPNSYLGFMFQAGYDNRSGDFNEAKTPCNCPADLTTKLTYFTIEPSLRLAPFKSNYYLFGGPRVGFNVDKSFVYQQGINPAYPAQTQNPDVAGDFSQVEKTVYSMQIGMGYDFEFSSPTKKTKFIISPFVSYQPYFGQNPRSIETWNISTVRAGVAFKLGKGKKTETLPVKDGEIQFSISMPENTLVDNRIREVFPLRNYIFFNLGINEIPNRYILLDNEQAKNFKEEQVQFTTVKNNPGRSEKQMLVYYNVLNILGDRMQKNPASTIKLVGSSELGPANGVIMAEAVKKYLVEIFGIASYRFAIEGRTKPTIPSEQPGGTSELVLLREGDQRVTIETTSLALLMEFQSGDAPLKPVEIYTQQSKTNPDDISFNVGNSKEVLSSWIVSLKDENGKTSTFGPYSEDKIILSKNLILNNQKQGNFNVTLMGTTLTGKTIVKENKVKILPFIQPKINESLRFSVIYEFNESKSITLYKDYLAEIVVPKIPIGGKVIIKGYTDIIGEGNYNQKLSLARANDVKQILETSLAKAGRYDVKFQVNGYGENPDYLLFENNYPEERFYNRTVVIDILPLQK